ncbi:methyl-accepting chemotaxis protein [Sagittula sp. NFXS13]|uniref:methyl-accepting chemotaxis protein n=1 Tax=Sagittula sp. NFXS13 TaxID=2819095 RepID=UPI0032DEC846
MSKFSIRIQVLFFACTFILCLVTVSALSWTTNESTARVFREYEQFVKQFESLNAVKEDVEQGIGDLLSFAAGRDEAHGSLMGNLAEISTELEVAYSLLPEGSEVRTSVLDLKAFSDDLAARSQTLEGLMLFDRKVIVDREYLPDFAILRDGVNALQEIKQAEFSAISQAARRQIADGETLLLVSNGVVILLAFGLAFVFGSLLSRPIRQAAQTVQTLGDGDYSQPPSGTTRGDEIGSMARGLETLRAKLSVGAEAEQAAADENTRRIELFQTLGSAMSQLRKGTLDARIDSESWTGLGPSYVQLSSDFNELAGALEHLVESLRTSTETVQSNAAELSGMSDEMARRAETQAATLEQSAAALDMLAVGVKTASARAQEADVKVVDGRRQAEQGGEVMTRALEAMSSIAKSSEQISQIIGVIDDIAFQTNLLALNAGVEAARAGESGKGFSVVASEVRGLAQRASESANQIKSLVLNSVAQVEDGEKLVQKTSETLTAIVANVTEVSEMVSGIATLSKEQAGGVEEINLGIAELDKVTQQNAAMVGETSTASQQLTVEATRLADVLTQFTGGAQIVRLDPSQVHGVPELFGDFEKTVPATAPPKPAAKPSAPAAKNDDGWDTSPAPAKASPDPAGAKRAVNAPAPVGQGGGEWADF